MRTDIPIPPRPTLSALRLGDAPERWEALGFAVRDGCISLGGVVLELDGPAPGITAWSLPPVDGLESFPPASSPATSEHPNGAIGLDHVVVLTPEFDRTAAALERAGMPLRRTREVPPSQDAPALRQGFRRLGPAILELVESAGAVPGPARFWGLVVIVADLDALAERLGPDLLGAPKPAVQPGRRIATLRREGGLGQPLAFMTPEPV